MASSTGATKPSCRYSSFGSASSRSPAPSPSSSSSNGFSRSAAHRYGGGEGRCSSAASSKAIVLKVPSEITVKNENKIGSMVRKFMEKKSKPRTPAQIEDDLKRAVAATGVKKDSNFSAIHRKLFQKGGKTGDAVPAKALTEARPNARTLAMVLRSERELLEQNREYESVISKLQSQIEDKEKEVEKLKDLCLNQREEMKNLKDQLQFLLENQGSELQNQMKSLIDDLISNRNIMRRGSCVEEHVLSPKTPACNHEFFDSLEFSSEDAFLEDMNPCLTPFSSKAKSKEFRETSPHNFSEGLGSSSELFFSPRR